jgi:hypothetical protein
MLECHEQLMNKLIPLSQNHCPEHLCLLPELQLHCLPFIQVQAINCSWSRCVREMQRSATQSRAHTSSLFMFPVHSLPAELLSACDTAYVQMVHLLYSIGSSCRGLAPPPQVRPHSNTAPLSNSLHMPVAREQALLLTHTHTHTLNAIDTLTAAACGGEKPMASAPACVVPCHGTPSLCTAAVPPLISEAQRNPHGYQQ